MKIGVISDTHNFLDPRIRSLFKGVDHILHGGDVGSPRLVAELEKIAPVTLVTGNTDEPAFGYPLNSRASLANKSFLLQHIVNPENLDAGLAAQIRNSKPDAVVFGHTHKPFAKVLDGVLFFNPGYAGKMRFNLPRSLAILSISQGIEFRYFEL